MRDTYFWARYNLPDHIRIAIREPEPPLDELGFKVVAMFNENNGNVAMRLVVDGGSISDYEGLRRELEVQRPADRRSVHELFVSHLGHWQGQDRARLLRRHP